ncbi:MAG: hypothetical protein SGARI_007984, partial [Bacillariaceae sp.]
MKIAICKLSDIHVARVKPENAISVGLGSTIDRSRVEASVADILPFDHIADLHWTHAHTAHCDGGGRGQTRRLAAGIRYHCAGVRHQRWHCTKSRLCLSRLQVFSSSLLCIIQIL